MKSLIRPGSAKYGYELRKLISLSRSVPPIASTGYIDRLDILNHHLFRTIVYMLLGSRSFELWRNPQCSRGSRCQEEVYVVCREQGEEILTKIGLGKPTKQSLKYERMLSNFREVQHGRA